MLARPRALRAALALAVALSGAAGCLVVSPLEPLPDGTGGKSTGGVSGGGKNAGAANAGTAFSGAGADEAGAAPGAGKGGSGGGCQTNADCAPGSADAPYRCRPSDHTCVKLISPACPLAYGDTANPNAVYFGAFAAFNPNAPADSSIIWSHRLALEELSGRDVGGLPNGSKLRRPLVMIVCNNDSEVVDTGMKHLAEAVQVPAVLATLKPDDLRRSFETYRDIFYLSPVSVTRTVVEEQDDGMIWNLLGQPSDMAPTYRELLKLAEKRLRKERNLQPADQLKVALVTTTVGFDTELAGAVGPLLTFNGQSAKDNGTNYFPVTLDPADPQLEQTAQSIASFGPDVIISAASELFSMEGGLFESIEDVWGAPQNPQAAKPRPFYILSPYNAGDLSSIMRVMNGFIQFAMEPDPELRFVGVSIAGPRDNSQQNTYALSLLTSFAQAEADTANYYDATYFLAYAMYGAGTDAPLTGSSIAQGMLRLLDGDNYPIGPTTISSTFNALSIAGSTVHVGSTLGPPDFDAKTGVRPVEGGVLCFKKMGFSVQLHSDVLRYDVAAGALTGTFPCFSGFYP